VPLLNGMIKRNFVDMSKDTILALYEFSTTTPGLLLSDMGSPL